MPCGKEYSIMKKIISIICLVCMLAISLTSCGFLVDETGRMIDEIKKTNEFADGSSEITITFIDDLYDPVKFTIPSGNKGDTGNGIENIDYEYDENNRQTKITISFTDEEEDDVVFNVPDGKTVTSIKTGFNEITGKSEAYFIYNGNDEDFVTLELPEFSGISEYVCKENDDKSIDLKFKFNLLDQPDLDIHIPPPEKGNGIAYMTSGEKNGQYILTIVYTEADKDGKTTVELPFDKPADPNSWTKEDRPPTNAEGRNGDFWFDSFGKTIYSKQNNSWAPVISFNDQLTYYDVVFNNNDGTGYSNAVKVQHGCYYDSTGSKIPKPDRAGYNFCGWYRSTEVDNTVMSPFTDLTPVYGNLQLYATWEIINYTVTYELDGGENNPNNLTVFTVENEDIVLLEPAKSGYTFGGWYSDPEFANTFTKIIVKDTLRDLTVYAKWIPNS